MAKRHWATAPWAALLLSHVLSASSAWATSGVNSWVSELLASVRDRSEAVYQKVHYPLLAPDCAASLLQHEWDFLPFGYARRRLTAGVAVRELTGREQALLGNVLGEVFAEAGLRRVESARRQDQEIHDRPELLLGDRFRPDMYGYDTYQLAIFGDPAIGEYLVTLQGHHLYLAIPVRNRVPRLSTPLFFGEYPNVTELGPQGNAARDLAAVLKARGAIGVDTDAVPQSMILRPANPQGIFLPGQRSGSISAAQLENSERLRLRMVADRFLESFPDRQRADFQRQIETAMAQTPERVLFRWEGSLTPGSRNHFYVFVGLNDEDRPAMAFEHEDLTDAKGKHIHSLFWTSDNFGGL